jgi:photosystem II stability/assembly factor-like uncharacterized protein
MTDEPTRNRRARRAVPLMAAAIAAILVAGILYVRSVPPAPNGPQAPRIPVMSGPYTATYDFVTPLLGWSLVLDYSSFSTNYWIFKTTDGARHWDVQHAGQAEGGRTYIHFFDELHGFAYAGISYRTVDGGAHWLTIEGAPGATPYITFASPTRGWAVGFEVGSQHLYTTSDGGATWTRLPTDLPTPAAFEPVTEIQSSAFRDTGEGWVGAGYLPSPVVFLTLDGGTSWRELAISSSLGTPRGAGYLTSARLVPGDAVLVLVSDDSAHVLGAFLSGNRGVSWRQVTFPIAVSTFDDLAFVDATNWWTLRSGHIWTTPNAGLNWTQLAAVGLPDGWRYEGARVIDARHAWWWMVSSFKSTNSALAMTSDGGEHWTMVNSPQPQ